MSGDGTNADTSIVAQFLSKVCPVLFKENLRVWNYTNPNCLGHKTRFDCGILTLAPSNKTELTGFTGKNNEISSERVLVLARGSVTVQESSSVEDVSKINLYDCIYLPPGSSCLVENTSTVESVFAWASSTSEIRTQHSESKKAQIIKTLSDITPVTLTVKGLERAIYPIKQTKSFHFALFKRGANTYSPLHTHDPPDFEEAFIVLKGNLWVTDLKGTTHALDEFDFACVPPFGGNLNENKSDKEVSYIWIGAPPVNMKELPVDREFSKYKHEMSLNKAM